MFGATSFFPAVGGHEGAGIVVEVGPGVTVAAARRPRVGELRAELRPLPLVLDREAEPVRQRRGHPRSAA